jgi:replication factor C subunit 1
VVIGENAGASKIAKLKDEKLKDVKHLDEDGFLALIEERSRGGAGAGQLSETQIKAKEKEEKKVRDQVKEMEKQEKEEAALQKRKQDALSKTGIATK